LGFSLRWVLAGFAVAAMKPRRKKKRFVLLGQMSSPAKARAARLNGRLGGRPKKFSILPNPLPL
jgi:hypothetical protein